MEEIVDTEKIINEVGNWGCYQVYLFATIVPPVICIAMLNSQYVFNAADIKYRCFVPECEKLPAKLDPGAWASWALDSSSNCRRRVPIKNTCEKDAFSSLLQKCTAWVYENNDTIVAEFNLACQDWKRALVGSVHSLGIFTALTYIGVLSDTIGRRTTFILASFCGAVMGLSRSFTTNYIAYVTLEYLDAALGTGVYSSGYLLVLEMVGKQHRVKAGAILSSSFSLGFVLLAGVAYLVPYWRHLTRAIYSPALLFVLNFFFLSESVRWLVSRNKVEKAIKVLKKVAKYNRKHLSEMTITALTDYARRITLTEPQPKTCSILRKICHSKILKKRLSICAFCWMTVTLIYYGLTVNSVFLKGNKYLNFAMIALVEIPGYIMATFLLQRFGRKRTLRTSLSICGILLLVVALQIFPHSFDIYLAMFAKCWISLVFAGIYLFTTELFPTNARHSLLGVCSFLGRIGSITAPLTTLLLKKAYWLPYVMFATMACIATILLGLVPETIENNLPDTISQAEGIQRREAIDKKERTLLSSRDSPAATSSSRLAGTSARKS